MLREARGGLKATVGNKVKPDYHLVGNKVKPDYWDHNENKIYPDLYYAIPAIVSLIVELLRPV